MARGEELVVSDRIWQVPGRGHADALHAPGRQDKGPQAPQGHCQAHRWLRQTYNSVVAAAPVPFCPIIDAVVGAVNPLFTRAIINELVGPKNATVVGELAVAVGVLAIFDAGLGLWERWISSRVGEGLIFDMRTKVFAHFQRMPIAFFSRTQTGALIAASTTTCWMPTRLHRILSTRCRQHDQRGRDAGRDVHPELADHAAGSADLSDLHPAGRVGG